MKRLAVLAALLLLASMAFGQSGYRDDRGYSGMGYAMGGGASVAVAIEELNYIFVYPGYVAATHNDPDFAAAIAAADQVILLDEADAEFAHIQLARAQPNAALSQINSQMRYRYYVNDNGQTGDYYDINDDDPPVVNADRRITLFHIAFENYIPAGSQIVKAEMHQIVLTTFTTATVDTTYTVLMTNQNDSDWWGSVGITNPALAHAAHSSWGRQIEYKGTEGYPAAGDSALWSPTLEDRHRFWDWGATSDARGYTASPVADDNVNLPLTNCVQEIVNGAVNNGIATIHFAQSTINRSMVYYNWETGSSNTNYEPWVSVKFLNKSYISPMPNDGEVAFIFIVDDLQADIHEVAGQMFGERGGRFTTSAPGVNIHSSDTNSRYIDIDSLVVWYDEGILEIANHSYYGETLNHFTVAWPDDPYGDATEYTQGMYPSALTGSASSLDSLLYTTDREWLFYEFGQATGRDWTGAPRFAKSLNHPTRQPSPAGFMAINLQGHTSGRMPIVDRFLDADGYVDFWDNPANARGDTLRKGLIPQATLRPQNLTYLAMSHGVSSFVGASTDDPTEGEVYYLMRLELEKAKASGRRVVSFFTHGTKSNTSYTTGIDEDELGWILDAADDTDGAVVVGVDDVISHLKRYSTPAATPASYAQSDTFKYTADDDVWGVLYGSDGNFVPAWTPVVAEEPTVDNVVADSYYIDEGVGVCWTANAASYTFTYNQAGVTGSDAVNLEEKIGAASLTLTDNVVDATATDIVVSWIMKEGQMPTGAQTFFKVTSATSSNRHQLKVAWDASGVGTVAGVEDIDDSGIEDLGSGWYRAWFYIDLTTVGRVETGHEFTFGSSPWGLDSTAGNAMLFDGLQIEYGVTTPSEYTQKNCGS